MQSMSASSAYPHSGGGGGHVGDYAIYGDGDGDGSGDGAAGATASAPAAAASEVFRDFTWYSAMLLSHIYALEHAQLERLAALEESRRSDAATHSPQLLMTAAVEAVNAAVAVPLPPTATAAAVPRAAGGGELTDDGPEDDDDDGGAAAPTASRGTAEPRAHTTATLHRPHVLLGFSFAGGHTTSTVSGMPERGVAADGATRWSPPACAAAASKASVQDNTVAALIAVFDAFYFPAELFCIAPAVACPTSAAAAAATGGGPASTTATAGVGGCTSSSSGGGSAAPRVTAEALREAFHALLVLGQRCAVFALTYRGIVAATAADGDDGVAAQSGVTGDDSGSPQRCTQQMGDQPLGGGGGSGFSSSEEEVGDCGGDSVQQAAAAALQLLLQLACSCPCAPLAYAAQLCLAHALATQPPPRSSAGWHARQLLLRYLPTLQPQSRAVAASDTSATSAALGGASSLPPAQQPHCTGGGGGGSRVPATQYVRPEDATLWFDEAGAAHTASVQHWWEAQQQQQQQRRGAPCLAHCGPLPATTALPTVQRLLMEEEAYMGPSGSAAAALKSVLDSVATEVRVNARLMPGSPSSLVHTSLRRRRGGPQTSGHHRPGQEDSDDGRAAAAAVAAAGRERVGGASAAAAGGAAGAAAVAPVRLSKAAKRRRALLFALAQSHLLPPAPQLATAKTLLYGVFTDGGECPSYYKLLSLYPDVLRAHHAALHYVLFEDGPLSVDTRLMVATMAASRHRCEYLVSRFAALLLRYAEEAMLEDDAEEEYDGSAGVLYSGGSSGSYPRGPVPYSRRDAEDVYDAYDELHLGQATSPTQRSPHHHSQQQQQQQHGAAAATGCLRGRSRQRWITHGPPARLRAAQHFIALAAHTPWMLGEANIRGLLACGWTIPEVFQLVAIVAQVVPLCGLVMGLFVPAEPWAMTLLPPDVVARLGHRAVAEEPVAAAALAVGPAGAGGMVSSGSSSALSGGGGGGGLRRTTTAAAAAAAATAGVDAAEMVGNCPAPSSPPLHHYQHQHQHSSSSGGGVAFVHADPYRRYAGDDSIVSEQRIKGGAPAVNQHTLWRSQFTWNEVGATSMEQYYPGAATLLNEEMECFCDVVRQLTKADCVGLMSPDYAPSYAFRSLQLYVQNLVGFMVEDYPYNDINKVLRRPAKWFAQVLTMRPETLSRSEVVRWYVPTTPPTGKTSDMNAESSLVTHQLKREIELLSVVDSAQGGHRGGIESASAHPEHGDTPPPTPAEAARDAAEAEALQTALTLQDERVLVLIALATMEARKEGLLHLLLRPVCTALNNM